MSATILRFPNRADQTGTLLPAKPSLDPFMATLQSGTVVASKDAIAAAMSALDIADPVRHERPATFQERIEIIALAANILLSASNQLLRRAEELKAQFKSDDVA